MAEKNHIWKQCSMCNGTGKVEGLSPEHQPDWTTCDNCKGEGKEYWGMLKRNGPPE